MTFKSAAQNFLNEEMTTTTNGMAARKSSASKVLDFFSKAGSSRGTDLSAAFVAAMTEGENLAVRTLLWTRDIREGAGEREQFRNLVLTMEKHNPSLAARIMHKIPVLGRWDDILFVYKDPVNRKNALRFYADALFSGDALAAKWAPREKSSKKALAHELRSFMRLSPREYRKLLVNATNVVESKMCAKEWDSINFSHVPSLASARYQKAFGRNAGDAYGAYLRELQKPVSERSPAVKINAGAVYPYDVVKSVIRGNAAVANEQWKALPNYVGDARIMPMVDVSGSMGYLSGTSSAVKPIDVAVSLGLYLSEKNTSVFKDMFMTFSARPKLEILRGTLSQRVSQLSKAEWEMNTNLVAAFDQLLNIAVRSNVSQKDMPAMLLVLSDMQFDSANTRSYYDRNRGDVYNQTAMEMIKSKYSAAGYKVPTIVFWNLSSYGSNNTPVRFDDLGVCHVSGFSPAIMKSILADDLENYTPYNVMLKTILDSRYDY